MSNTTSPIQQEILNKLKSQHLFGDVEQEHIETAFTQVIELHLLKGELVFRTGERYHRGIYFVTNGTIALKKHNTDINIQCTNTAVGLSSFMGKTTYTSDAIAEVDSDVLFVPEICIYNLMAITNGFRSQLVRNIKERLSELQNPDTFKKRTAFSAVSDYMSSPIMTIQTGKTVMDASEVMTRCKVESLLVVNRKQIIKGLITSSSLIENFMPNIHKNINSPEVEKYADKTPLFFPPELPLNEAVTELQVAGKSHAIIINNGKPAGIISKNDITNKLYCNYQLFTTNIYNLNSIEELKEAYINIINIAGYLSTSSRISRETLSVISHIYYAIQCRIFSISIDEFKKSNDFDILNYRYAYLVLGSAARREMNLHPYINHAVILSDDISDEDYHKFIQFSKFFNKNLERVGYKLDILNTDDDHDKGLIKRLSDWLSFIDNWTAKDSDNKANACFSCIMDMSIFDGDINLSWQVRRYIIKRVKDRPSTLAKILKLYPSIKIPVSQFGSFITEKDGNHQGLINLQGNALSYLVNVTRLLALHAGINDIGTVDRILHLKRIGLVPKKMAADTIVAFDTIVETMLSEQIYQHNTGQKVTTYIDPASLSLFYQEKLKRALQFLTIYTSHGINYLKEQ